MRKTDLLNTPAKLLLEDNVIAVTSDRYLTTVSSAIYNGGFKKVKAILNIQVPEGYSDIQLHDDPLQLVKLSSVKVGVHENYLAMITAAKAKNMHHVSRTHGQVTVNVIATAGASHGESAGEPIDAEHALGTINIIAVIHGNPTDSCLVAAFVTATEAKTAALNDLDIRSRYSGKTATGTITDSLSVATTNVGETIELGGPASNLGQLVAGCVRDAVTEAIKKQDGTLPSRSVSTRLRARHLSLEKLAAEFAKVKSLGLDEKTLFDEINLILADPIYSSFLLAAAKLDDDVKKGLVPSELENVDEVSRGFGNLMFANSSESGKELDGINLPQFLKHALFSILRKEFQR